MNDARDLRAAAVWALLPVKDWGRAKSRLAGILSPSERAALARSLFERAMEVLARAAEVAGILVLTDSRDVAAAARERGAIALLDAPSSSLSAIVDRGLEELAARGAGGALVLMSDLPYLEVSDVDDVLRAMRESPMVVVPDLRDEGTNVLGLAPPTRSATCFGFADSFRRHCERARAGGFTAAVHHHPRLGFDVDTPEDYRRMQGGQTRERAAIPDGPADPGAA